MNGKFRVWDKDAGKYSTNEFAITKDGRLLKLDVNTHKFCEASNDRYMVEHSTGCNDKNGKEIFEGDVCDLGNNHRITIIFKDAGFGWLDFPGEKYAMMISFSGHNYLNEIMSKIEVIGNIHEVKG